MSKRMEFASNRTRKKQAIVTRNESEISRMTNDEYHPYENMPSSSFISPIQGKGKVSP